MPKPEEFHSLFPQQRDYLRIRQEDGRRVCPLGMLPCTARLAPEKLSDFDQPPTDFTVRAVRAFFRWWDEQDEAASAVAAVWGEA